MLKSQNITQESPTYIKELLKKNNLSMLHFELLKEPPTQSKKYNGGNWYGSKKPRYLLNPTSYLQSTVENHCKQSDFK